MAEGNWKAFFKDKKITQMGLGLLGRGVGDAEFLAECGVDLLVTDKKTEEELKPSFDRLSKFKNPEGKDTSYGAGLSTSKPINFHLGEHRLEDFSGKGEWKPDFILKGAGVPLDSPYIVEAWKNGIPIEMDASLFVKLAPSDVKIIGVTGTRGKTTTTMMIYKILEKFKIYDSPKERLLPTGQARLKNGEKLEVFLGGNIKDTATLPLLKKVKSGDYVVMELDSWQLQGFGESEISPNISVFTTFMEDHMNYYNNSMEKYFRDKANIFLNQKDGDIFIAGERVIEMAKKLKMESLIKIGIAPQIARAADFPVGWNLKILGEHNRFNAVCAILVARALKIPEEIIREAIENFNGIAGRLELVREINGVKVYNDTTSTTPVATIAGLQALGSGKKNVILILGGSDKGLDMRSLIKEIPNYCKIVVLLEGTGTTKIEDAKIKMQNDNPELKIENSETLEGAIKKSLLNAKKGDVILFSPAFASFGMFKNEYDRGEKFNEIVRKI